MSLKANPINQIPKDTERIAKAAFPKGNRYMLLRDTFGDFFNTTDFKSLFSSEGKPAEDPARLALIIILQFTEQLSDERMADAVRSRIDFKYLLALPLDDPGFDSTLLSRCVPGTAVTTRVPHPTDRRQSRSAALREAASTLSCTQAPA